MPRPSAANEGACDGARGGAHHWRARHRAAHEFLHGHLPAAERKREAIVRVPGRGRATPALFRNS